MEDPEGVLSAVGRVLDAHLHVVDLETCVDDLTGNPNARWWEQLDSSPDAVAARAHAAGVSGGVLVQAVGAHSFDNSLVVEAAQTLGENWRAMVAVGLSVNDPLSVLDRAAAQGASGLRLFSIPDPWLHSDVAVELLQRCRDSGVGPNVCCFAEELQAVARIAAAVPDCEIALDHCGFVSVGGDDQVLVDLAKYENLVVKLSTGVFDASSLSPRAQRWGDYSTCSVPSALFGDRTTPKCMIVLTPSWSPLLPTRSADSTQPPKQPSSVRPPPASGSITERRVTKRARV